MVDAIALGLGGDERREGPSTVSLLSPSNPPLRDARSSQIMWRVA